MTRIVFVVLLFLTGCTTIVSDTPFEALSAEARLTNRTTVIWETVDDVDAICKKLNATITKDSTVYGCAQPTKNYCKIYTGKTTTMPILGHEFRHCFEGNFHK